MRKLYSPKGQFYKFKHSTEKKAEFEREGIEHLEFRIVLHDMQGNITLSIIPVHIFE